MSPRYTAIHSAALKRLVASGDQSYIASVLVALDARDIPHVEEARGAPWVPATAVLVRELDLIRAGEAIKDLQRTAPVQEAGPVGRVFIRTAVLLFIIALVTGIVFQFLG
ncbi:MAG TPA: hypothetical protein VIV65_10155 [Gemmatimonadaceae bacterium]